MPKRKVFISYHHKDQYYRDEFERLFGHLFISKSVNEGDIDEDNSSEYVKRLINEGYIDDASIVIVLIGAKTYCRRHVDWEIYGGIDVRVGGRAGLMGICLPSNPDYPGPTYQLDITPARFVDNQKSGFALYYDWTEDEDLVRARIERAFDDRITKKDLATNSRKQLTYNLCD